MSLSAKPNDVWYGGRICLLQKGFSQEKRPEALDGILWHCTTYSLIQKILMLKVDTEKWVPNISWLSGVPKGNHLNRHFAVKYFDNEEQNPWILYLQVPTHAPPSWLKNKKYKTCVSPWWKCFGKSSRREVCSIFNTSEDMFNIVFFLTKKYVGKTYLTNTRTFSRVDSRLTNRIEGYCPDETKLYKYLKRDKNILYTIN